MRQKSPSNQSHGKHQWNNIVLNQARIEEKDAEQQNRNPLTQGESTLQIPARQMKQYSKYGDSIQQIDDGSGDGV